MVHSRGQKQEPAGEVQLHDGEGVEVRRRHRSSEERQRRTAGLLRAERNLVRGDGPEAGAEQRVRLILRRPCRDCQWVSQQHPGMDLEAELARPILSRRIRRANASLGQSLRQPVTLWTHSPDPNLAAHSL